jgi:putative methyltransferase (TIGR04325 family)
MLAPVVVFAYNRPDHLKRTLDSLMGNQLAAESDLFIFIDGPKLNASAENIEQIKEVKNVARLKKWCKNVEIREASSNKGLAVSIIEGVTEIVNKYGRIIVLEDDMVSSPYMLQYFNEALDIYANTNEVISISGYMYPVKEKLPETFFVKGADCWSWATWKRGWDLFDANGYKLLSELRAKGQTVNFDFNGTYPYTKMLEDQVTSQNDSWAVRWYASAFLKNKLTLYPSVSLITNTGTDGSGTHGDKNININGPTRKDPITQFENSIKENAEAQKAFENYFSQLKTEASHSSIKKRIADTLPYPLAKFLKIIFKKKQPQQFGWFGNYNNWQQVKSLCTGYDQATILEKVKRSVLKVKRGEAAYERDSVLFHRLEYSNELLELFQLLIKEKGCLDVVDYGGSLGSTYFQYQQLLGNVPDLKWSVVEQSHFVDCGNQYIAENSLSFFNKIEEAIIGQSKQVLLLSSVIQYLEKPYDMLKIFLNIGFDYVIIDRTGFIDDNSDRLTIQRVPSDIYEASYPAWFFNEEKFVNLIKERYVLKEEFNSKFSLPSVVEDKRVYWKGFILQRKP